MAEDEKEALPWLSEEVWNCIRRYGEKISVEGTPYEKCELCGQKPAKGLSLHIQEFPKKVFSICDACIRELAVSAGLVSPWWEYEERKHEKAPIPPATRWAVWRRDDFTCQYCGKKEDLACHHIIPESKGGDTTFDNLTTACRQCNSRIGTDTIRPPVNGGQ